jgi:DNA-3-methyladenine glycosylase
MKKLPLSFYHRTNVLQIARELLGKLLITKWEGLITSARIVEVEAYNGVTDRASHAWNGRRTARTEIMYAGGGVAYVYLCYGIHHLFNVVTNVQGIPHAILIRAGEPVEGIETMLRRSEKKKADYSLTKGPGNLARALGLSTKYTGHSLTAEELYLADDNYVLRPQSVSSSPRIGVDYAGEDALLPYRFFIQDNPYVSGKTIT